jgi:hypothetical protein
LSFIKNVESLKNNLIECGKKQLRLVILLLMNLLNGVRSSDKKFLILQKQFYYLVKIILNNFLIILNELTSELKKLLSQLGSIVEISGISLLAYAEK